MVFVNVLEHINDDAQELAYARDMLQSGGHLLIFVPALPILCGIFFLINGGHDGMYALLHHIHLSHWQH